MPRKTEADYKIRPIRWDADHYEKILQHCEKIGERPSAYIKNVVFKDLKLSSSRLKKRENSKLKRDAVNEINKLGVNINQIARQFHKGIYPNPLGIREQLQEVLSLLKNIKSQL